MLLHAVFLHFQLQLKYNYNEYRLFTVWEVRTEKYFSKTEGRVGNGVFTLAEKSGQ